MATLETLEKKLSDHEGSGAVFCIEHFVRASASMLDRESIDDALQRLYPNFKEPHWAGYVIAKTTEQMNSTGTA